MHSSARMDPGRVRDFCLGDTGSMAGHAPPATVAAIARQAARGITLMLPTDDANWVAEEMDRRFAILASLPSSRPS